MGGFIVLTLVTVFCFGLITGSIKMAGECEKLGSFYVGGTVYECKVKGTT